MSTNIEIKARLQNATVAHGIATQLSEAEPELIRQRDVFFATSNGRLKLRILESDRAELISYRRSNISAVRRSDYQIVTSRCPIDFLNDLTGTHSVIGVVTKLRWLYRVGQTRIHIDCVRGLGDFLEFEVVMRPNQREVEGHAAVNELLQLFGVKSEELMGDAYVDLLNKIDDKPDWQIELLETLDDLLFCRHGNSPIFSNGA